ncbi:hypothetical protein ACU686_31225 [Yinghuangia aomiensis]
MKPELYPRGRARRRETAGVPGAHRRLWSAGRRRSVASHLVVSSRVHKRVLGGRRGRSSPRRLAAAVRSRQAAGPRSIGAGGAASASGSRAAHPRSGAPEPIGRQIRGQGPAERLLRGHVQRISRRSKGLSVDRVRWSQPMMPGPAALRLEVHPRLDAPGAVSSANSIP